MKKYLATIEFRYTIKSKNEDESDKYNSKTITIGVFDDIEEAIKEGNKVLVGLESRFKLHKFPDGIEANKKRFSKNGGCFGGFLNLVTDLAYLKTPFNFYAKIDTLIYEDVSETITTILKSLS